MARRKDGRPRSLPAPLPAIPSNEEIARMFPSHELSKPRETETEDE